VQRPRVLLKLGVELRDGFELDRVVDVNGVPPRPRRPEFPEVVEYVEELFPARLGEIGLFGPVRLWQERR